MHRRENCGGTFVDVTTLTDTSRIEVCPECRATRRRPLDEFDDDGEPDMRIFPAPRRDYVGWSLIATGAVVALGALAWIFCQAA